MSSVHARHLDRISDLPDSVIDYILVKLPTFDAVRTSILSRRWRHAWTRLTRFSLNVGLLKSLVLKDSVRSTVTMMLLQLMLKHDGPIRKFTLAMPCFESCPIIDNLINFLSRNNIENFKLVMWEDVYSVPASIFECQLLRHLSLKRCRISNPPQAFKGFSRLTSLKLFDTIISEEAVRSLISNSPLLRSLVLALTSCQLDIYIDARNLRYFAFMGGAKSMSLQLMPLLDIVSINVDDSGTEPCKEFSLTRFFRSLPALKSLYLHSCTIEKFIIEEPKLSTPLVHLENINLRFINFDEIEVQFTLCLLRSSPNVKSVEILIDFPHEDASEAIAYMKGEDYSDIWLSQLENVEFRSVTGSETELELIKLLLAKSPSLKKINIMPGTGTGTGTETSDLDKSRAILKEALKFERASKEARVIYAE